MGGVPSPSQPRAESPEQLLAERLSELTVRDEHRLRRRLDRLRNQQDAEERAAELTRLAGEVEKAQQRVERRRAGVPEIA